MKMHTTTRVWMATAILLLTLSCRAGFWNNEDWHEQAVGDNLNALQRWIYTAGLAGDGEIVSNANGMALRLSYDPATNQPIVRSRTWALRPGDLLTISGVFAVSGPLGNSSAGYGVVNPENGQWYMIMVQPSNSVITLRKYGISESDLYSAVYELGHAPHRYALTMDFLTYPTEVLFTLVVDGSNTVFENVSDGAPITLGPALKAQMVVRNQGVAEFGLVTGTDEWPPPPTRSDDWTGDALGANLTQLTNWSLEFGQPNDGHVWSLDGTPKLEIIDPTTTNIAPIVHTTAAAQFVDELHVSGSFAVSNAPATVSGNVSGGVGFEDTALPASRFYSLNCNAGARTLALRRGESNLKTFTTGFIPGNVTHSYALIACFMRSASATQVFFTAYYDGRQVIELAVDNNGFPFGTMYRPRLTARNDGIAQFGTVTWTDVPEPLTGLALAVLLGLGITRRVR